MHVVRVLLKGMAIVLLTVAFFFFCGWLLLVANLEWLRRTEDPTYATDLFAGHLSVAKVLATRKWHRRGGEPWDCSYAIVDLADGAPNVPPSWSNSDNGWKYKFGGDWKETPEPESHDNMRRALRFCSQYFDDATNDRLFRALAEPGSWYVRGPVGEILYIYSLPQNIAARIRVGD